MPIGLQKNKTFVEVASNNQPAPAPLEYVHYFPRQLLTADDMRAEQTYFREKLRRHNRMLHGSGVVCGLKVRWKGNWVVTVGKGYAISPNGDEICIPEDIDFDLAGDMPAAANPCAPSPCSPAGVTKTNPGQTVMLSVCYSETCARPVRLHPSGCGCGCSDADCEYTRVREGYELVVQDVQAQSRSKGEIFIQPAEIIKMVSATELTTVDELIQPLGGSGGAGASPLHWEDELASLREKANKKLEDLINDRADEDVITAQKIVTDILGKVTTLYSLIEFYRRLSQGASDLDDGTKQQKIESIAAQELARIISFLKKEYGAPVDGELVPVERDIIPRCPPQSNDCCVALASILLPGNPGDPIDPVFIEDCRELCIGSQVLYNMARRIGVYPE